MRKRGPVEQISDPKAVLKLRAHMHLLCPCRSLRAKWEGRQQDVHQSEASVKTKQEEQTMHCP